MAVPGDRDTDASVAQGAQMGAVASLLPQAPSRSPEQTAHVTAALPPGAPGQGGRERRQEGSTEPAAAAAALGAAGSRWRGAQEAWNTAAISGEMATHT